MSDIPKADYVILALGITYLIADYLVTRRRKQYTGRHAMKILTHP